MKVFTILSIGLQFVFFVAGTPLSHAQGSSERTRHEAAIPPDSMFLRPHDVFPENLLKLFPTTKNPSPTKVSPRNPLLVTPDVSISADTFPQNEPSVKISRKDPLNMVAAWRDFRTGVSPAVRRVGYSYSTDGGATWSVSTLTPPFNATYPRTSDPAVGVDTAGNFYIVTISITNTNGSGKIAVYKSTDQGVSRRGGLGLCDHDQAG